MFGGGGRGVFEGGVWGGGEGGCLREVFGGGGGGGVFEGGVWGGKGGV